VLEGEIQPGDFDKLRILVDPNAETSVGVGGVGGDWYRDKYSEIYLARRFCSRGHEDRAACAGAALGIYCAVTDYKPIYQTRNDLLQEPTNNILNQSTQRGSVRGLPSRGEWQP
jgi:hypothetical protein